MIVSIYSVQVEWVEHWSVFIICFHGLIRSSSKGDVIMLVDGQPQVFADVHSGLGEEVRLTVKSGRRVVVVGCVVQPPMPSRTRPRTATLIRCVFMLLHSLASSHGHDTRTWDPGPVGPALRIIGDGVADMWGAQ